MKLQQIGERKGEGQKKNEVAELLLNIRKTSVDADLVNALPLRLDEIDSFIRIVHAALESGPHDASFYRDHVERIMCLLEERFNELQIMVRALVDKEWAARRSNNDVN